MQTISEEKAIAFQWPAPRTGDSITVDPDTRRIVAINGEAVTEELHTSAMQAYADEVLDGAQQR